MQLGRPTLLSKRVRGIAWSCQVMAMFMATRYTEGNAQDLSLLLCQWVLGY